MPQPPILLNVTLTCYHLCKIKQQTLFQSKLLEQIANKKLVRKPVVNNLYFRFVKDGFCMSERQ